jgi:uncharacterized membrane protein YfcA
MDYGLIVLILLSAGFAAGFIDTLAGGGGLISLPALLITGLPPLTAFGTNKLQALIGESTAALRFFRQGKLQFNKILRGMLYVVVSSSVGALAVQQCDPVFLEKIIPFLLLLILIYMILAPRWLNKRHAPRLSEKTFYIVIGFVVGFYNGFLGPGTGAFWMFAFVFFLNYSFVDATIYTKPLNSIGNIASLLWFVITDHVNYQYFILMAIGQFMGAYIAAHLVIYKGHWLIRPVFIAVVLIMLIISFYQNYSYIPS